MRRDATSVRNSRPGDSQGVTMNSDNIGGKVVVITGASTTTPVVFSTHTDAERRARVVFNCVERRTGANGHHGGRVRENVFTDSRVLQHTGTPLRVFRISSLRFVDELADTNLAIPPNVPRSRRALVKPRSPSLWLITYTSPRSGRKPICNGLDPQNRRLLGPRHPCRHQVLEPKEAKWVEQHHEGRMDETRCRNAGCRVGPRGQRSSRSCPGVGAGSRTVNRTKV